MRDLNAVVEAESDRVAATAILRWECWERGRTALSWARRFREAYRTGKLELWKEKR